MDSKTQIPIISSLRLPDLILLEEYKGDIKTYLEEVYKIFNKGFVKSKPTFQGVRLGLKKYPIIEDKEYTFYHMTHSGDIENDRTPDLRRMERMPYPRPIIDNSTHADLKVWKNQRGTDTRILIWHEKEEYLVVLTQRKDYILPWTAYLVLQNHSKKKLMKEYEDYIKSENRTV
jgi:hypothetical protein